MDRNRSWASQWFADQGFAVIVADGRGTPGRGPRWERARGDDHAGPRLQDQVDALHAAAERFGDLDLTKVAIRGRAPARRPAAVCPCDFLASAC